MGAWVDGRFLDLGHTRQRCVLAVLLVEANRVVPVDQLVERVWGERSPQRAQETLYSYLSRLRQALSPAGDDARITRQAGGYTLAVDGAAVDLHRFRRLVALARTAEDDDHAVALFEQALALWHEELFPTVDTPWFNSLRDTLQQERLAAELDHNDIRLRLGHDAGLLAELSARVDESPLDERLVGQLVTVLYRHGRVADALERCEQIRRRLAEELGADPSPGLQRLHQQILVTDPALAPPATKSAPASPRPPVPRQLLASPPAFTGRDTEVKFLCVALAPGGAGYTQVVALDGLAGVGKSALAVHVGHRVADRFPDGQLYINLQGAAAGVTPLTPHEVLVRWLPQLGVPGTEVPAELETASALFRSVLNGRRLLLILDDASSVEQVRPLLPAERGCAAIITSRNVLSTLDGAAFVHVEPLAQAEARVLLGRLAGDRRVAADPAAAEAVVTLCEGLPLLLRIVAARLAARPGWPIRAIADRLAEEHRRLNELQVGELSIRASLAVSLRGVGDEGARVFAALSLVGAAELDLPLAASLANVSLDEADAVLEQLVDARLIDSSAPGFYRMHDVVRLYAREHARQQIGAEGMEAARRRAARHYLALAEQASRLLDPEELTVLTAGPQAVHPAGFVFSHRSDAGAWIDFVAPHLAAVMTELTSGSEIAADAARCALVAYPAMVLRDRWPEMIRLSALAVSAARGAGERPLEAHAHNTLGIAYGHTGRLGESVAEVRTALRQWEELDDQHGAAKALNNLGIIARIRGDLPEAIRCHERSLALFQAADDLSRETRALANIAQVRQQLGDHGHAIAGYGRTVEAFRALGDRYRLALALGDLAQALRLGGRVRESVGHYEDSLRVFRETGNRFGEARSLWGLAHALHDLGEPDVARDHWRTATNILHDCGELADEEARRLLGQPIPETPEIIRRGTH